MDGNLVKSAQDGRIAAAANVHLRQDRTDDSGEGPRESSLSAISRDRPT